jgi:hypothetical protein
MAQSTQTKVTINRLDEILCRPWEKFGFRVFSRDTDVEVFEGQYPTAIYNADGIRTQLTAKYNLENFRIETIPFPSFEELVEKAQRKND